MVGRERLVFPKPAGRRIGLDAADVRHPVLITRIVIGVPRKDCREGACG